MKEFKKDSLTVKIFSTREEMGHAAAEACISKINELLANKSSVNMIFAAAPSQREFLSALVSAGRDGRVDFTRVNAFHMDEYIGLPDGAPQRFSSFLKNAIFDRLPFKSVNLITPGVCPEDECRRYAKLLAENPCDIVCMGIGENGHIAFNDPHVADFNDPKAVKIVTLDERCREQQVHDGCFPSFDDVPSSAITLTIPALISASHVFCMVPSSSKAEAVKKTVHGDISEQCPASILRRKTGSTLWLDAESAQLL